MKRLVESAFYAALMTMFGFGFYYSFGLLFTLTQGGDTTKFFIDSLVGGFIAFLFFWCVCWEISGAFERFNKSGRDDDKKKDGKDESDPGEKKS